MIILMVSVILRFFVDEISFWGRYVASFVRLMPALLNFLYLFLELISLVRVCVFMSGCIVFLNIVKLPQNQPVIQSFPKKEIIFTHTVSQEGASVSFSKEGISLDEVTKVLKSINDIIPDSYLHQAKIKTKVLEENGRYIFSESYITGLGFKIYLKSIGNNIVSEWIQKDSKKVIKHNIGKDFSKSIYDKFPKYIADQIIKLTKFSDIKNIIKY